jgi:hypothetical protein
VQTHKKPDNHDVTTRDTNNGSGRLPECSRCRQGGHLFPQRAALKDRAAALTLETLAGFSHQPSCSRRAENERRRPSTEIRLGVLLGASEPNRPSPEPHPRPLHKCERGPPGSGSVRGETKTAPALDVWCLYR